MSTTETEAESLQTELDNVKDDNTDLREANRNLQNEIEELRLTLSQSADAGLFQEAVLSRDKKIEELQNQLDDATSMLGSIKDDLHRWVKAISFDPDPTPLPNQAEQFGPLIKAADEARNWFVDNWPKIINLVCMAVDAGLEEDLRKRGIVIVDPGGRLIELDKALNVAKGHTVQVRRMG